MLPSSSIIVLLAKVGQHLIFFSFFKIFKSEWNYQLIMSWSVLLKASLNQHTERSVMISTRGVTSVLKPFLLQHIFFFGKKERLTARETFFFLLDILLGQTSGISSFS